MSKKKKVLPSQNKFLTAIAIVILVVWLSVVGTIAYFFIDAFFMYVYMMKPINENPEILDISMTTEERLSDLEYLYETAYLSNPNLEEFEKLYGANYSELYARYQDDVKNCKTDFDFYYLTFTFLRNMPSGHTVAILPIYSNFINCGFQDVFHNCEIKNEEEYLYSWKKLLMDEFAKYDSDTEVVFYYYIGGEYILGYSEDMPNPEEAGAVVVSINGIDPDEYIKEPYFYNAIEYDDLCGKPFRSYLVFNDRYGEKVTYKLELADGTIVEKEGYVDEKYHLLYELDYNFNYVSPVDQEKDPNEVIPDSDNLYTLVEDTENNLIYLRIDSCVFNSELDSMLTELRDKLTRCDNVILDIRYNKGGSVAFYSSYIYPELFNEAENISDYEIVYKKTEGTARWANKLSNRFLYSSKFEDDGTISYREASITTAGNGVRKNNIYVLTSEKTFSSGDMIANFLSTHDNVTIVGTHTGGEGIAGDIFTAVMPVSHLPFSYAPGKNAGLEVNDSVYGTEPDIEVDFTVDAYRKCYELRKQGEVTDRYQSRLVWDNMLITAVNEINKNK